MRKCKVSHYEDGYLVEKDVECTFDSWGTTLFEDKDGNPLQITVGICEKGDGTVFMPFPDEIVFIDKK